MLAIFGHSQSFNMHFDVLLAHRYFDKVFFRSHLILYIIILSKGYIIHCVK